MARTIAEIKKIMTDKFMNDEVMSGVYEFEIGASFDATFSKVSIENILFYIVAFCINIFEQLQDDTKTDITTIVTNNHYGNAEWYNVQAKLFQSGDELVLINGIPGYAVVDEQKQIVKYSATVPGKVIIVKVAGEENGELVQIENTVENPHIDRLQTYFNRKKPAGTRVVVLGANSDYIKVTGTIYYDSLLFNADGSLIIGGSRPIDVAIQTYLKSIEFNGRLVKQKLIDAIQAVKGVTDVENIQVLAKYGDYEYVEVQRTYLSYAGWMRIDPMNLLKDTLQFTAEEVL